MVGLLGTILLAAAGTAAQAGEVHYDVRFSDLGGHEVEITATFSGVPAGALEVRMSRSSPGRYATHEFAKNVYRVRITDGHGKALTAARPNPHQWDVSGHDGTVKVTYTLFGDRGDGTYAQFDRSHALFNMPASFLWARGLASRPISITFHDPPAGWQVVTQLRPTNRPTTFTAPDLQYFFDSPTHVGPAVIRSWTVARAGRTDTIRLAIHDPNAAATADRYAEWARAVVAEETAVFGELPRFDYGTYTFIADYMPWNSGDGMEHRNSTILSSSASLSTRMLGNLGTLAHEFVHAWNVERIRPRALEPFNFEDANISAELWLAEGFTSYYGPLAIRRAGITDDAAVIRGYGATIDAVINGPGRQFDGPVGMSRQAPFVDAAVSIDPTNRASTFISYYTWGAAVGLGLDLILRSQFDRTLDDFMRAMWRAHGSPERPYTLADVKKVLGEVTSPSFAAGIFEKNIEGSEVFDYQASLEYAGVVLRLSHPGEAWIGDLAWRAGADGVELRSGATAGSPVRLAGLADGDVLTRLGGRPVTTPAAVDSIVRQAGPGGRLSATFTSRGLAVTGEIAVIENPHVEAVPAETLGRTLTPAQRAFRQAWLGSKAGAVR